MPKLDKSLRILTKKKEVKEAQSELLTFLSKEFPDRDRRNITFRPRGSEDQEVWVKSPFWYRPGRLEGEGSPRLLNWFGVIHPEPQALRIAVEVNIPVEGINHRIQGFFARDGQGTLHLMHTGRLGGGGDGVGGQAFPRHYGEEHLRSARYDSGRVRDGFIVTCLADERRVEQLLRYVQMIEDFREMHR